MSLYQNIIQEYFRLISEFIIERKEFDKIFHPDILQTEFPNSLTKTLTVSNFETLMKRMPAGKALLREQKFEIEKTYEMNDIVVVETKWTGIIKSDLGQFKENQILKAHFCVLFEFKEDKIFRQRNYDCFEPFA